MRIISVLSIIRLLLIIILPIIVLASNANDTENQKQSALNKIKNGKIENIQVEKNKSSITLSDNILRNQAVPREKLSVYMKGVKGYSSQVDAIGSSYGKKITIICIEKVITEYVIK